MPWLYSNNWLWYQRFSVEEDEWIDSCPVYAFCCVELPLEHIMWKMEMINRILMTVYEQMSKGMHFCDTCQTLCYCMHLCVVILFTEFNSVWNILYCPCITFMMNTVVDRDEIFWPWRKNIVGKCEGFGALVFFIILVLARTVAS